MIRVLCAECGETFEIGEELAGLTEFCPNCGALCDIPSPREELQDDELQIVEPQPAEPPPAEPQPALDQQPPSSQQPELPPIAPPIATIVAPPAERGIPSPIWWALILGAVAVFIVSCAYLFSDNWEMRNIQSLSDAMNRGDVLMTDEDFAGAEGQYQFVLKTVGSREIDSIYIRQFVERARRGVVLAQVAETQARNLPRPTTAPAATLPSEVSTPEEDHAALTEFQRNSEAFPQYIRSRPMDFQDSKGNWRRRQFTVWDVSYQKQPDSSRPRILLLYSYASRITEPHDNRREADNDGDFRNDESPKTYHCQTLFELFAGQWIVLHHDVDAGLVTHPLDEFYELERQAFHAAVIPQ